MLSTISFPNLDIPPNLTYYTHMDTTNLTTIESDEPDRSPKDASGYSVNRPQIDKVRYIHDAMIDVLIATPGITQGAIARHFDRTEPWVSTIFSSDAFQRRLAERRAELIDPTLLVTIEDRFKALALKSVERLMEHMNQPKEYIDPDIMIKAATLGAKSIGLGQPKVTVQTTSVEDELKDLGWKLTRLLHKSKESDTTDITPTEPPQGD